MQSLSPACNHAAVQRGCNPAPSHRPLSTSVGRLQPVDDSGPAIHRGTTQSIVCPGAVIHGARPRCFGSRALDIIITPDGGLPSGRPCRHRTLAISKIESLPSADSNTFGAYCSIGPAHPSYALERTWVCVCVIGSEPSLRDGLCGPKTVIGASYLPTTAEKCRQPRQGQDVKRQKFLQQHVFFSRIHIGRGWHKGGQTNISTYLPR